MWMNELSTLAAKHTQYWSSESLGEWGRVQEGWPVPLRSRSRTPEVFEKNYAKSAFHAFLQRSRSILHGQQCKIVSNHQIRLSRWLRHHWLSSTIVQSEIKFCLYSGSGNEGIQSSIVSDDSRLIYFVELSPFTAIANDMVIMIGILLVTFLVYAFYDTAVETEEWRRIVTVNCSL